MAIPLSGAYNIKLLPDGDVAAAAAATAAAAAALYEGQKIGGK